MNKLICATILTMFVLADLSARAQPQAGQATPDCLHLGTVYTGAIVEGSFVVYEPGKNPDIPFSVTAPDFVKVGRTFTGHQEFGKGNDFICGFVEFALDTSASGDLSGEFNVTLGSAVTNIPVSASVKPATNGLPRLLIVSTPFDSCSGEHGEMFKTWTDLVTKASLDVNYLGTFGGELVLRDLDLSKFDCVLLALEGLMRLQPNEIKRVREFAEAGGRVVVSADAFFVGSVAKANAVLEGYGIQMRDEEARGFHDSNVTVGKEDLDPDLVKTGVRSAHFFRASPIAVTDDKTGRILVKAHGVGEPGDGFVASAKAGRGEVAALGQSLWWNWITKENAAGTDNARLLRLLLIPPSKE